jgi:hypothetical protein
MGTSNSACKNSRALGVLERGHEEGYLGARAAGHPPGGERLAKFADQHERRLREPSVPRESVRANTGSPRSRMMSSERPLQIEQGHRLRPASSGRIDDKLASEAARRNAFGFLSDGVFDESDARPYVFRARHDREDGHRVLVGSAPQHGVVINRFRELEGELRFELVGKNLGELLVSRGRYVDATHERLLPLEVDGHRFARRDQGARRHPHHLVERGSSLRSYSVIASMAMRR